MLTQRLVREAYPRSESPSADAHVELMQQQMNALRLKLCGWVDELEKLKPIAKIGLFFGLPNYEA